MQEKINFYLYNFKDFLNLTNKIISAIFIYIVFKHNHKTIKHAGIIIISPYLV
jgi:hypothetical protein